MRKCQRTVLYQDVRVGVTKIVVKTFYKLPSDDSKRHQWLVSIKKPITVSPYTYMQSTF